MMIIGTTNYINNCDDAAIPAGRINHKISIGTMAKKKRENYSSEYIKFKINKEKELNEDHKNAIFSIFEGAINKNLFLLIAEDDSTYSSIQHNLDQLLENIFNFIKNEDNRKKKDLLKILEEETYKKIDELYCLDIKNKITKEISNYKNNNYSYNSEEYQINEKRIKNDTIILFKNDNEFQTRLLSLYIKNSQHCLSCLKILMDTISDNTKKQITEYNKVNKEKFEETFKNRSYILKKIYEIPKNLISEFNSIEIETEN